MFFSELALRHYHHRRGVAQLTPGGLLAILIIAAICAVIVYFYSRVKKNGMISALGLSSEEEYNDYKKYCTLNFNNKFCISDEWVINEYSFRVYPTDDIVEVMRLSGVSASGSSGIYKSSIEIRYRGGTDKFLVRSAAERERLYIMIERYLSCRRNGTVFVQDDH